MNDSLSYERILKLPTGRATFLPRLLLTLLYLTLLGIWLLVFFKWSFSAPLLVLAILSLLGLILPTLKYGSVEYEYIFSSGMFYCAKVELFTDFSSIDNLYIVGNNKQEEQKLIEKPKKK